jgi:Uma2 family endonuclease
MIMSMGTTTTALMTFEEFEELPDQPGKLELLEGELIELPIPESKHTRTGVHIYKKMEQALLEAKGRGLATDLGEAFPEIGYKLSGRSYVRPDVSVTHAGQAEARFFEGSPAIAIEIVSPNNTALGLDKKVRLYFQFGAREVWVVYPITKHVMVYFVGGVRDFDEHQLLTTPLLPGFELSVRAMLAF